MLTIGAIRVFLVSQANTGDDGAFVRALVGQFMVGPRLLVAPVVEEGAVERTVVFPPGRWYGWFGSDVVDSGESGTTVTVPAACTQK